LNTKYKKNLIDFQYCFDAYIFLFMFGTLFNFFISLILVKFVNLMWFNINNDMHIFWFFLFVLTVLLILVLIYIGFKGKVLPLANKLLNTKTANGEAVIIFYIPSILIGFVYRRFKNIFKK